jgi:phage shock protein PspC (stress-responsive transcriptional regulator)
MLFGVAGGMAEWLDLDPSIVRLVWALLILAAGIGIVLYLVAAIVIPEAPYGMAPATPSGAPDAASSAPPGTAPTRREARMARRAARGGRSAGMAFGLILVAVGAWFLLRRYLPTLDLEWVVPGALIVIGLVLVVGALGRSGDPEG